METVLRRNRSLLNSIGAGIIAIGFWSIIKAILSILTNVAGARDSLAEFLAYWDSMAHIYVIFALLLVFILLLHLYVGLCARAEGQRGKQGALYIIVAAALALLYLGSVIFEVVYFEELIVDDTSFDTVVSLFMDITSLVILCELIVAAVRVKYLTRKMKGRG